MGVRTTTDVTLQWSILTWFTVVTQNVSKSFCNWKRPNKIIGARYHNLTDSLKRKCTRIFGEIVTTGWSGNCHFDNDVFVKMSFPFQCSRCAGTTPKELFFYSADRPVIGRNNSVQSIKVIKDTLQPGPIDLRAPSQYKDRLIYYCMAISMLKIRRPLGRLIFNMGIAIPGKTVFLIETAPRILWGPNRCMPINL